MASADYRLCDVCDNKAFYDASLNYETAAPDWAPDRAPARYAGNSMGSAALWIDHLGDWAVLCSECAKTHRAVILGPDEVLLTRNQLPTRAVLKKHDGSASATCTRRRTARGSTSPWTPPTTSRPSRARKATTGST